jgi:hypothetical protein
VIGENVRMVLLHLHETVMGLLTAGLTMSQKLSPCIAGIRGDSLLHVMDACSGANQTCVANRVGGRGCDTCARTLSSTVLIDNERHASGK